MMGDRVMQIDEVDDAEKLEIFFEKLPRLTVSRLIFRSALRALPVVVGSLRRSERTAYENLKKKLILRVFKSVIHSWVFCRDFNFSSSNDKSLNTPLYDGAYKNISEKGQYDSATFNFITSLGGVEVYFNSHFEIASATAAFSVECSAKAFSEASPIEGEELTSLIWVVFRKDLQKISDRGSDYLWISSLWNSGDEPFWLVSAEEKLRDYLAGWGADWLEFWIFYHRVKLGSSFAGMESAIEEIVSTSSEDFWERDPDLVMRDLAERLGRGETSRQTAAVSRAASEKVDFFISYSTKNEAEAREVNGYLENSGYSTIAQFKDFAVGSNFVIEMQEGLDRGARAIVLLSPEYVASDHCRAEWAALYNTDPLGKGRKLVPLLLKPASLNQLARQIVYKSLFGLKVEERRAAVLEAIGHKSDPLRPDVLKRRLAETASPDVAPTPDGQLDAVPNAIYDRPVLDGDLPDLPEVLKSLCRVIQSSLPENSPKTIAPTMQEYGDHLRERGLRPIVNLLCIHADSLRRDVRSVEFHVWGDGLASHFENFFSCHTQFITHFPKSQEREEILVNNDIDEDVASGKDFIEPVKKVADALGELHLIGGTTPAFERVVKDSLQRAKDIDTLPNYPNPEDANAITPKRRFVFSQIGFWERILSALGSMTTLASTEQGRAAIAALSEAIKKFLSFASSN